jgi:hypothetical protein
MEHKDKSLTGLVPIKEHPSFKQAFEHGQTKRLISVETWSNGRVLNFWSDGSVTWSEEKPTA